MPGNEIIGKEEFDEIKKSLQKVMVYYLLMLLKNEEKIFLE